jgi:hypothetical protein
MVAAMTSPIGGQPGTLMMGRSVMILDGRGAGGVGFRRLDTAVRGATAPRHDGLRAGRGLLDDVERRAARHHAVHAIGFGRDGPFAQQQVLARVLLHHVLGALLGLVSGGRLQGLRVVE